MQAKNPNKIHCSDNTDPDSRQQCDTCHMFEREQAAEKAEHDPLNTIASICRSLTYGEMMELGRQLAFAHTGGSGENLSKSIHKWSKNYGMDNISDGNSSNIDSDITAAINDLYTQDSNRREP